MNKFLYSIKVYFSSKFFLSSRVTELEERFVTYSERARILENELEEAKKDRDWYRELLFKKCGILSPIEPTDKKLEFKPVGSWLRRRDRLERLAHREAV